MKSCLKLDLSCDYEDDELKFYTVPIPTLFFPFFLAAVVEKWVSLLFPLHNKGGFAHDTHQLVMPLHP